MSTPLLVSLPFTTDFSVCHSIPLSTCFYENDTDDDGRTVSQVPVVSTARGVQPTPCHKSNTVPERGLELDPEDWSPINYFKCVNPSRRKSFQESLTISNSFR